jgi:hypothetical protein
LGYPAQQGSLGEIMMAKSAFGDWFDAGMDAWSLGSEASTVMALRTVRITMGGSGAMAETQLMFAEKMQATFELQVAAMTGRLGTAPAGAARKAIGFYRRKVRANRRRLSRD